MPAGMKLVNPSGKTPKRASSSSQNGTPKAKSKKGGKPPSKKPRNQY